MILGIPIVDLVWPHSTDLQDLRKASLLPPISLQSSHSVHYNSTLLLQMRNTAGPFVSATMEKEFDKRFDFCCPAKHHVDNFDPATGAGTKV
jgi:hypothetical protein